MGEELDPELVGCQGGQFGDGKGWQLDEVDVYGFLDLALGELFAEEAVDAAGLDALGDGEGAFEHTPDDVEGVAALGLHAVGLDLDDFVVF